MWDDTMQNHSLEAYLRRRTTEELHQIRALDAGQQNPDVIALVDKILQERESTPAE